MRIFEENGIELSIGQWQKLAVARALYSQSDILILDEPAAALDPMAEQEIFNQFDRLRQDKTTIFVSHRLSSATVASKIIVLEYGRLIEEGDHKTLMARHGRYFELFSTQAKRYMTADDTPEATPDGTPDGTPEATTSVMPDMENRPDAAPRREGAPVGGPPGHRPPPGHGGPRHPAGEDLSYTAP